MKKSDCKQGMRVWMKLRGQTSIATVRCLSGEDVHLEWDPAAIERARIHGASLPTAVGYQDIMPVEGGEPGDGQAPVTHQDPKPAPLSEQLEAAAKRDSQQFWAQAFEGKPRKPYQSTPEPVPQTDSSSVPPIRNQDAWPAFWRRFERIVIAKRELLRQLRNTERPSYVFTTIADVLAAAFEQSDVHMVLVRNRQDLTRLKLEVCEFLDEYYDYNPGPFIPPEPPTPEVDGTAPDAAR